MPQCLWSSSNGAMYDSMIIIILNYFNIVVVYVSMDFWQSTFLSLYYVV